MDEEDIRQKQECIKAIAKREQGRFRIFDEKERTRKQKQGDIIHKGGHEK